MTTSAPRAARVLRGRAQLVAVATGATVALLLSLTSAGTAAADPNLATARAQADALRIEVDRLHGEAEAAAEEYGAVNDQLGDVVTKLLFAGDALDQARGRAAAADNHADQTVRTVYMSGGPSALLASVLEGTDLNDVLDRMAAIGNVMAANRVNAASTHADVAKAVKTQADIALLTAQERALEDRVVAASDRAAGFEAAAADKLASADNFVRQLVESERARAAAAAEATASLAIGTAPWAGSVAVPTDQVAAVDRAIAEATAAPATPFAVAALRDARQWLGTPYSAGGGGVNGPGTGWCSSSAPDDGRDSSGACRATNTLGFDCSSFMVRIYSQAGLALPRTSRQQWFVGSHVTVSALQPGDLLFWANNTSNAGSIHHVAMYLGHGLMVHSPHTGDHIRVAPVYFRGFIGAARPA